MQVIKYRQWSVEEVMMLVQITNNFKNKQVITAEELAQLIANAGGITRQDLIFAFGSKMARALKTIETTKTFKMRKLSGLSSKKVYVYYSGKATYEDALANHFKALGAYALREIGCKISRPMVLNGGSWGINLVLSKTEVLPLETVVVDTKNFRKLKGAQIRKRLVPLYIFINEDIFKKVKTEGLLYGESICVVNRKQTLDVHVMDYLGRTEPLTNLQQLTSFEKISTDKENLVNEILGSYNVQKFARGKKVENK